MVRIRGTLRIVVVLVVMPLLVLVLVLVLALVAGPMLISSRTRRRARTTALADSPYQPPTGN
jgi:hypothetical protein